MANRNDQSADEQPTQPDIGAAFDVATRELCRLLLDMQVEREALVAAVHTQDSVEIGIAANDIVCVFQAAQRALKVLRERLEDAGTHEQSGRSALRNHRRALEELFQRGIEQTAGTATQDRLRRLLAELGPLGDDLPGHGSGQSRPACLLAADGCR